MKILAIFLLTVLVIVGIYESIHYSNRQKIDFCELQISLSPDKQWAVFLRTTSTSQPEDSFAQILVFKTDVYPNLKQEGAFPSTAQCNNPHASFLIPVMLYARMADIRWRTEGRVVEIHQGEVNGIEPISYRLDPESFSFTRLEN